MTVVLTDQALRAYINAHPNAAPQEILEHFGIPFDRELYQAVLELSRKHRLAPSAAALLAQTLASSQGRDGAAVRRGALTSAS